MIYVIFGQAYVSLCCFGITEGQKIMELVHEVSFNKELDVSGSI